MPKAIVGLRALASVLVLLGAAQTQAAEGTPDHLGAVVDAAIKPLMQTQNIAGMAVAITVDGKPRFFNYGVASRETGQAVSNGTLFEIGSVSKTYTATLAAYAVAEGKLSLNAPASRYLTALRGTVFDKVSVLNLGTYSAGGLPLQFPAEFDNAQKMISYYQQWKPSFAVGSQRLYSNPSLGLFGYLAAQSLGQPFDELMAQRLFPKLGLNHSYIKVPQDQMGVYAQGYSKDDKPVRLSGGALDSEAYGVKTSSADLLRYVEVNLQPAILEKPWQQAVRATHTGYYTVGDMTQGLGWERYAYPVSLDRLLAANSTPMAMEPHAVTWLNPPQPEQGSLLFNKTGSTGGFGTYVVFVPSKRIGIVLLANKNYPIDDRVKVAHAILSELDKP